MRSISVCARGPAAALLGRRGRGGVGRRGRSGRGRDRHLGGLDWAKAEGGKRYIGVSSKVYGHHMMHCALRGISDTPHHEPNGDADTDEPRGEASGA